MIRIRRAVFWFALVFFSATVLGAKAQDRTLPAYPDFQGEEGFPRACRGIKSGFPFASNRSLFPIKDICTINQNVDLGIRPWLNLTTRFGFDSSNPQISFGPNLDLAETIRLDKVFQDFSLAYLGEWSALGRQNGLVVSLETNHWKLGKHKEIFAEFYHESAEHRSELLIQFKDRRLAVGLSLQADPNIKNAIAIEIKFIKVR